MSLVWFSHVFWFGFSFNDESLHDLLVWTWKIEGDKPEQLIERILGASSFKLNWVLDPFTRSGGVGVIAKKMGRRFIGFESNKDQLLMALKRIDREK
jgi:site-specific DNA-methyltransferase (adenine-specific)